MAFIGHTGVCLSCLSAVHIIMELIMAYTPSFKSVVKASNFVTNNPTASDMQSFPTTITGIAFNENTRSLEVTCDDRRMRQCRVDRMPEEQAKKLEKDIVTALNTKQQVIFHAAGNNNPNVWFYKVTKAIK
jgi:predicted helicase